MNRSQTKQSPSGTATRWSKSALARKKSKTISKKKSKTGNRPTTKVKKGQFVFSFGAGRAEGNESDKLLLGGKGANLHGMVKLGLPVPSGFTISTEVCSYFYENKKKYPKTLDSQVKQAVQKIEKNLGRKFGDRKKPLLVSVRSGAPASMPGMMDTILNLGLNDETVQGLAEQTKNKRFALDSYRRLITMYSNVVLGVSHHQFEIALEEARHNEGVEQDFELSIEALEKLIKEYKKIIRMEGKEFPEDPWEQLWGAVGAVFGSWMNPRAITYRRLNDIPSEWGTAVNVQSMVFGNMGDDCATGVAFTRDPSTGRKAFFGEFLVNAQGEDVVAGIRTPQPINEASRTEESKTLQTLEKVMPKSYKELVKIYQHLEKHYQDMQDIEFTIEGGKLFILQTRNGKRTAAAAMKIAVDMVKEKLITKNEAIMRIKPEQLDQLLHPRLDPKGEKKVLAKGLPASPGAASGQVVFSSEEAEKWVNEQSKKVILVRVETSPEDIGGMSVAQGILTVRGGMTSHAAVVARGMGKCCVSGCGAIKIHPTQKQFEVSGVTIKEGDFITLDGSTGEVILGKVATLKPELNQDFKTLMGWVNQIRDLGVRANADTPQDAKVAREFGAEGIGLCRTEHMFFDPDRIQVVREMILADSQFAREKALEKILPMQKEDFKGLFEEMKGLPVTIRLLDPPLHEFIPHSDEELEKLSKDIHVPFERLKAKAESLKEFNPMLGHRGCRLGISFPEIYKTQVRAVFEAACELWKEKKIKVTPEVMIPLVGEKKELEYVRGFCEEVAKGVMQEHKVKLTYLMGTMIELPRAALTANEIAEHADFFSFGTNDLTQTTLGLSRDDSSLFLKDYMDAKIYEKDPFASLDQTGVGKLIQMAKDLGRKENKKLKLGICGEHGGDPESIEFCQKVGLDYVSCSPFRVPIALLASAQAKLKN